MSFEETARERAAEFMLPLRKEIEKLLQDARYSSLTFFVENGMWSEPNIAQAYTIVYFPAELDENGDEIDAGPGVEDLIHELMTKISGLVSSYEDKVTNDIEYDAEGDTYPLPDEYRTVSLPDGKVHTFSKTAPVISVTCRVEP